MNILFAGSPKSSSRILEFLADEPSINIKGVLTQPDRRRKRGNELYESDVAKIANKNNLRVFKPITLDDSDFKNEISALEIDLFVVIAYGKLIPKWLLELPKFISLNVHFSILPKYRGASPIQSSILSGDKETGISFMHMNEELDEGGLILIKKIKIKLDDNKITVEDKLTNLTTDNILDILFSLKQNTASISNQDNSRATYCKKILKEDSLTDFKDSAVNIINKYRAYIEWPVLSFIFKEVMIKVHEISITDEKCNGVAGTINRINQSGIYINTKDKVIVITYLQFPNKNKISSLDVYNSYQAFFK